MHVRLWTGRGVKPESLQKIVTVERAAYVHIRRAGAGSAATRLGNVAGRIRSGAADGSSRRELTRGAAWVRVCADAASDEGAAQ